MRLDLVQPVDVAELADQILAGSVRALSRGLSWIEQGGTRAEALVDTLYPHGGNAYVVGITGAPGSGKSSLVRALARAARARNASVGVIAVDPSSPFTGGSILGDRIRMSDLSTDSGVFIRSMATRGTLGGLCSAAGEAVDVLRAAGRDLVLVETVGVGQDEVDVMRLAHTTVVVSVPGLGDDIQAIKAGILEIADVHVVNKADRAGANRTMAELKTMLAMNDPASGGWAPPIVPCVATTEEGASELLDEIHMHREHLTASGEMLTRERRIAEGRVLKAAQVLVAQPLAAETDDFRTDLDRVARREVSPYRCARALIARASEETERTSSRVR